MYEQYIGHLHSPIYGTYVWLMSKQQIGHLCLPIFGSDVQRRDVLLAHSVDVSSESEEYLGGFDVAELTSSVQRRPSLRLRLQMDRFRFGLGEGRYSFRVSESEYPFAMFFANLRSLTS